MILEILFLYVTIHIRVVKKAIDFNYFGFLLSSNMSKASFSYNEIIQRNEQNGLKKDSIAKCDDFIKIEQKEIAFKIGCVEEKEIEKFIEKYKQYLEIDC